MPASLNAALWDADRERAVAEKLAADLENGEIIWLSANAQAAFPAIYTLPETNWNPDANQGTVILLHGMGGHPDWPVVISPLRNFFNQASWKTLSIQLPVLSAEIPLFEYGNTVKEAARRIKSSIAYLEEQGDENIILIGYGFGAATAAWFLANEDANNICAFAGISMHARKFLNPALDLLGSLANLHVPILDIYGTRDQKVIMQSADDRRLAARKNGNDNFTQVVIEDGDQYYTRQEQELFDQIMLWLASLELDNKGCSPLPAGLPGPEITGLRVPDTGKPE